MSVESDHKQMPEMGGTETSAVSTEKIKSIVKQLSEECLAEVVEALDDNKDSFENFGEITESDNPSRTYVDTESGMLLR